MVKSTKRGLLFALLATFGLMGAVAQNTDHSSLSRPSNSLKGALNAATPASVVHNRAWYEQEQFDYNWTDADGISHTSKLTDIATNPYQIVALIQMIYCNPDIPGIKYSSFTNSSVYYGSIGNGWNISNVTPPTEEGYTVLIVAMKYNNNRAPSDVYSRSALINYIDQYIESVQLLTDGMRIGSGYNEGTIFNISGSYNRFFFISKGKLYDYGYGVAPFDLMFEEFSPTSPSGGETTDFYAKMVAGETYPIIHDCPSVIYYSHYFSMAGKNGTEKKSMTGLNVFITDYRNNYYEYTYSNGYQPLVGLYTINLSASATLAENPSNCDVTLNWTSSLDQMAKETVPQNYTVYLVLTDEYGVETYQKLEVTPNPTGATTLTYTVPRSINSYTINYIISGTPSDENYSDFFTWSNTASVVIPGMSANEAMSLYLNHYESDYKADVERNYYRNLFNVKNENIVYGITPAMIAAGHNKFDIYRYDNGSYGTATVAGHVVLSLSGSTVRYNVTYENQDILPGFQLSQLGIATNGSLGTYSNDAIVNMSAIFICDQFSAETRDNTQPTRYEYVLREDAENDPIFSNTVVVPVFKTASSIDGFYTLDEVMNDTDAELTASVLNTNVEMQLSNNPSVYYYTLMRGINTNPDQTISKLQHRTDGSYLEMLGTLGYEGEVFDLEGLATKVVDRLDNAVVTGGPGEYASYQPVLWTFGNDRLKGDGDNSYGAPIWKTGVGYVLMDAPKPESVNYGKWWDENGDVCTVYSPVLSINGNVPVIDGVEYEPFMYRVWRLCDGVRGFTYMGGNLFINDPSADRSEVKLVAEEMTDEPTITIGGDGSLDFGATVDCSLSFRTRFYYVKKGQSASDKPMFYVVEYTKDWDWTGIDEIASDNVVSKTYYNGLGIPSQTPHSGINIVVTRYSDGTTTTSKVVR